MSAAFHYQKHLDRVSRSFAFCIARLEGDLRAWVGLSYLLCRILDTVEDALWPDSDSKNRAFAGFEGFLREQPSEAAVSDWAALFPSVSEGERELLADSCRIFSDLHALSPEVREKIRRPVLNMYRGMKFFSGGQRESREIRLRSLAEVNQYCFFVAGLVGDLLTNLVSERWPSMSVNRRTYIDAHHFGLFLQKVNLLKDQSADEKEGRFLVPSRPELLASLRKDAEGALRYIQSLPIAEKGFRLFCAWSLFMGLASLPWAERGWASGILGKLPRLVTQKLLNTVEGLIDDNQALVALFWQMLPALPKLAVVPVNGTGKLPWFGQVYDGQLSEADLAELGMLPAV
ncbi:MAG TPA: squalene/phytoene synthase family protein [Bdellovibrionota bacterium]|jgi:phytoene/squalene synthetase